MTDDSAAIQGLRVDVKTWVSLTDYSAIEGELVSITDRGVVVAEHSTAPLDGHEIQSLVFVAWNAVKTIEQHTHLRPDEGEGAGSR